MDVSHLRVQVSGDGIAETSRKLSGLGVTASNTETKVLKLTERIEKLIGANVRLGTSQQTATAAAHAQAAAFVNLQGITGTIAANMAAMIAAVNQLNGSLLTLHSRTSLTNDGLQRNSKWGNVWTSTLKAMATAAATYAAGNLVKSIVAGADAWAMMQAKLKLSTGSMEKAVMVQEDLFQLSQKLRSPTEDMVRLFNRMSYPMEKMGKSTKDAIEHVEYIAMSLAVAGATAAEASSVMLQYSQSVNQGFINGAEFNAVSDASPNILRAIEAELRATGKWGIHTTETLKKMGSEGKITFALMAAAAERAMPQLRKDFEALPLTFDGAMQRIKNAWAKATGELGADTGFNKELSKSLRIIEDMIPAIAQGLGKAFIDVMGWIERNRDILGQIWDQTKGIVKDVWEVAAGLTAWGGEALSSSANQLSLIAFTLFSIRLFVAGIQDGFKLIVMVVASLGGQIIEWILNPIRLVLWSVGKLIGAFESMARLGAGAYKFLGMDGLADGASNLANTFAEAKATIDGMGETAFNVGDSIKQVGRDIAQQFMDGDTAVNRLLNSTNELSVAAAKAKSVYAAGTGGKGGSGASDKELKAAKKAAEEHLDILGKLNQKIAEQRELQERLNMAGLGYDKISEGTKARIKWETELEALRGKSGVQTERAMVQERLAAAAKLEGLEKQTERTIELLRLQKTEQDAATSKMKTLEEEAKALEIQVETFGMAQGAIEAKNEEALRGEIARLTALPVITAHEEALLAIYKQQAVFMERKTVAGGVLGALEAAKDLDKLFDSSKPVKFADDFAKAFGKAGKSIGGVIDALAKMDQRQDRTTKMYEKYNVIVKKNATEGAKYLTKIREQETIDTLDSYADMAGAAKNLFDEKSKGYKAMEAAEKTFRAFEMAMAFKKFVTESGLIGTLTSLFVASKATETTAVLATVAPTVGANLAKTGSNATTALSGALAVPFPGNIAAFAIVAAMLASIGVAVGGGSSGGAPLPPATGTGTVFGDKEAKSESLSNSIELLADIDTMTMRYSAQMAASLANIEAAMGGVANLVVRNPAVATGANFSPELGKTGGFSWKGAAEKIGAGFALGGPIGAAIGAIAVIFGKRVTKEISGAGVMISGALGQLRQGEGFEQYVDVKTTSKRFGRSKRVTYNTEVSELGDELSAQFGSVLDQLADAVALAGESFGMSASTIQTQLDALQLDIGRIDLFGLTGEQIQEKLAAVFGAAGDTIAKTIIPGLEDFQQVGEGYFETVIRVSSGVESARYELERLGITAVALTDILNTQGDVSAEMVRQSILAVELGTGIGDIVEVLTGSGADIAEAYTTLLAARRAFSNVGMGADVSTDLIRAAGGLDSLQDALQSYTEGFFSSTEQRAMEADRLTDSFAKLGLAMPVSREAFRGLIDSLTASGQESLAVRVLLLAEAFAEFSEEVGGTSEATTAAREALSSAYERESSALESVREKFQGFADSLREFRNSLLTGELSTLTDSEKLSMLRSEFETTGAAALAGDEGAIGKFQGIAQEFLQFSREFNASGMQYTADFEQVLALTQGIEFVVAGQVTMAEQQLIQMEAQVSALITINESVLTVAQAIANLHLAEMDGSHASGLSFVPFDGYKAELHKGEGVLTAGENRAYQMNWNQGGSGNNAVLVSEIRALREEVTQLRTQQSSETAAIIGANYDANDRNAQVVVEGAKDAASTVSYADRVKGALV